MGDGRGGRNQPQGRNKTAHSLGSVGGLVFSVAAAFPLRQIFGTTGALLRRETVESISPSAGRPTASRHRPRTCRSSSLLPRGTRVTWADQDPSRSFVHIRSSPWNQAPSTSTSTWSLVRPVDGLPHAPIVSRRRQTPGLTARSARRPSLDASRLTRNASEPPTERIRGRFFVSKALSRCSGFGGGGHRQRSESIIGQPVARL